MKFAESKYLKILEEEISNVLLLEKDLTPAEMRAMGSDVLNKLQQDKDYVKKMRNPKFRQDILSALQAAQFDDSEDGEPTEEPELPDAFAIGTPEEKPKEPEKAYDLDKPGENFDLSKAKKIQDKLVQDLSQHPMLVRLVRKIRRIPQDAEGEGGERLAPRDIVNMQQETVKNFIQDIVKQVYTNLDKEGIISMLDKDHNEFSSDISKAARARIQARRQARKEPEQDSLPVAAEQKIISKIENYILQEIKNII